MGATQVSAWQDQLEQPITMQKSDFPRLKTSELPPEEIHKQETPSIQPQPHVNTLQVSSWVNGGILLLQILLFLLTFYLVKNVYRTEVKREASVSTPKKELAENDAIEKPQPVKKRARALSGMIADFDKGELVTTFGTPIRTEKTNILKLSLDSESGVDKKGKTLQVQYSFNKTGAPSKAIFNVDLPAADINQLKGINFYLRASAGSNDIPKVSVVLIGVNGQRAAYRLGDIFSFWKKYQLDFDTAGKALLENEITSLEFVLEPQNNESGTFYIDNISFI